MDFDTATMGVGSDSTAYYQDYPTPSTTSQAASSPAPTEPPKKKRKAWGQPVPEIKQILPPRKRAKTDEEKEQRKNERILRNRKAADKSRQRQKAAVAMLEVNNGRIVAENAHLRALLERYQQRFGIPDGFQFEPFGDDAHDPSTPISQSDDATNSFDLISTTTSTSHPTLVKSESTPQFYHASPSLTSPLVETDNKFPEQDNSIGAPSLPPSSVLTHYSAAVMCDPQCQTETSSKLGKLLSQATTSTGLQHLFLAMHLMTISQTYSTSMLLPMFQIFRILEQRLDASSTEIFQSIMSSFHLIHCLISQPSTQTRKAVFRLKLLSRLLASSPSMARLLMAATDRALQQVVSSDGFAEDTDLRWTWASLMTIKWGIIRLEREHRKIRQLDLSEYGQIEDVCDIQGVDCAMVARNKRLWTQPGKCISTEEVPKVKAQAVH